MYIYLTKFGNNPDHYKAFNFVQIGLMYITIRLNVGNVLFFNFI